MSTTCEVRVILEPDDRAALPVGPELHEHVRASRPRLGNAPPAAFERSLARVEALEAALADERGYLQGLVREAHRQGVPQNTLARWARYTPRWIAHIIRAA